MSDPRNVAHAKKVTQEKKHHATDTTPDDTPAAQPGKKQAAALKTAAPVGSVAGSTEHAAGNNDAPGASPAPRPSAALDGSLAVLSQLKELEFHSRANLERLAALVLTVQDELKQTEIVVPLDEVYSAQNVFQTKLTTLIEAYKAECDHMQSERA